MNECVYFRLEVHKKEIKDRQREQYNIQPGLRDWTFNDDSKLLAGQERESAMRDIAHCESWMPFVSVSCEFSEKRWQSHTPTTFAGG